MKPHFRVVFYECQKSVEKKSFSGTNLIYTFAADYREVAQLASALRSGRRGRVFESPLPDNKGIFNKLITFKR